MEHLKLETGQRTPQISLQGSPQVKGEMRDVKLYVRPIRRLSPTRKRDKHRLDKNLRDSFGAGLNSICRVDCILSCFETPGSEYDYRQP
jgi:hypothetical protein